MECVYSPAVQTMLFHAVWMWLLTSDRKSLSPPPPQTCFQFMNIIALIRNVENSRPESVLGGVPLSWVPRPDDPLDLYIIEIAK